MSVYYDVIFCVYNYVYIYLCIYIYMYMIYVDIDMIVHAETFMKRFFADSSSGIIQGYLPLANSKEAGQTTSSVGEEGRSGGLPTIGQA